MACADSDLQRNRKEVGGRVAVGSAPRDQAAHMLVARRRDGQLSREHDEGATNLCGGGAVAREPLEPVEQAGIEARRRSSQKVSLAREQRCG